MINKEKIEAIEKQKQCLKEWINIHFIVKDDSYMRFNYDDCWNLYQLLKNTDDRIKRQENRIKELEEINAEHQKLNGELQVKITELENTINGIAIQELGTSDLYKED